MNTYIFFFLLFLFFPSFFFLSYSKEGGRTILFYPIIWLLVFSILIHFVKIEQFNLLSLLPFFDHSNHPTRNEEEVVNQCYINYVRYKKKKSRE